MFRRCALRTSQVQRALRPTIHRTILRVRGTTSFSSTALRAQQLPPPANEEAGQSTVARLPLSIQALYFEPLRRTPKYGLPVCNLMIRSYSVRQLEAQCDFALRAAYYLGLPASGAVPLPREIKRWTVPRSNFVHKKSQENYERITLKRVIQIKDGNPETIELWLAFLKKHAVYGVGMKANVWVFEEIGVGKKMNVSLENLYDLKRPKWSHFGPRKTVGTASMVRNILESDSYKIQDTGAAQVSEPSTEQSPALPVRISKPNGRKIIEPGVTDEELRFKELEVQVGREHSRDYLYQAAEWQRTAEDNLVKTREALHATPQERRAQEMQPREAPQAAPQMPQVQYIESQAERQRSEMDMIRDAELKKALEAKEAAEARAAEESKRTAEFQMSLLAQLAAMQAELAAMKAERSKPKEPEPAPAVPQPVPIAPQAAPIASEPAGATKQSAPITPEPTPPTPQPAPFTPELATAALQPDTITTEPAATTPQPAPTIPEPAPTTTAPPPLEAEPIETQAEVEIPSTSTFENKAEAVVPEEVSPPEQTAAETSITEPIPAHPADVENKAEAAVAEEIPPPEQTAAEPSITEPIPAHPADVENKAEAVVPEEVSPPEQTAAETSITEPIPAHPADFENKVEAVVAEEVSPPQQIAAESSTTEPIPAHPADVENKVEAVVAEEVSPPQQIAAESSTTEPIPAHPADEPAETLTATPEAPAIDHAEATLEPQTPEQASEQSLPSSTEATSEPSMIHAQQAAEDTIPRAATEEIEPIPYESSEPLPDSFNPISESIGTVATTESAPAAEEGPAKVEEPVQTEESAPAPEPTTRGESVVITESQKGPETVEETQPQQQDEKPSVGIVHEDSVMDELPPSTETPETPDAVKRQPELTRDEEPAPERHEKPEEVKEPIDKV